MDLPVAPPNRAARRHPEPPAIVASASGLRASGRVLDPPGRIRAGQVVTCQWVDEETVPAEHRELIAKHIAAAAPRAGLVRVPAVRWFVPTSGGVGDFVFQARRDDEIPGGATPREGEFVIGLLATLRGPAAVLAAVHELQHAAQRALLEALQNEDWSERDADHFARAYLETLQ